MSNLAGFDGTFLVNLMVLVTNLTGDQKKRDGLVPKKRPKRPKDVHLISQDKILKYSSGSVIEVYWIC